jgi:hypothetical protein
MPAMPLRFMRLHLAFSVGAAGSAARFGQNQPSAATATSTAPQTTAQGVKIEPTNSTVTATAETKGQMLDGHDGAVVGLGVEHARDQHFAAVVGQAAHVRRRRRRRSTAEARPPPPAGAGSCRAAAARTWPIRACRRPRGRRRRLAVAAAAHAR